MDGVDGRRGLGGLPELVRNLLQPALEVEGPAALHEVLDVVQNLMTHHMQPQIGHSIGLQAPIGTPNEHEHNVAHIMRRVPGAE